MSFVIAQISDTHLSAEKPFFLENFRLFSAHLRQTKPDLVVNTGDISLDGAEHAEDLATARELHEELGLPYRVIPGNHDVGDNREVAHKQAFDTQRQARWRGVIGDDFWVDDVPGWRLLGINSLLLGSGLAADEEQREFIRDAVAGIGDRALLLFVHKPLFDGVPEETELQSRFVNPAPRRLLLEALGSTKPHLVACGHVHQFRDTTSAGTRHVWAPGTSFVVPRWFQEDHGVRTIGYVEHKLEEDGSFSCCCLPVARTVMHDLEDYPQAYGDLRQYKAQRLEAVN